MIPSLVAALHCQIKDNNNTNNENDTWPGGHPALPLAAAAHAPQPLVAHLHQPWKSWTDANHCCVTCSGPAGLDHAGPGHLVHEVDQLHRLVLLLLLAHPFERARTRFFFAPSHRVHLNEVGSCACLHSYHLYLVPVLFIFFSVALLLIAVLGLLSSEDFLLSDTELQFFIEESLD